MNSNDNEVKFLGRTFTQASNGVPLMTELELFERALEGVRRVSVLVAGTLRNAVGPCAVGAIHGTFTCNGTIIRRIAEANDRYTFRIGSLVLSFESPRKRRNRMFKWLQNEVRQMKALEAETLSPGAGKILQDKTETKTSGQ